MRRISDFKLPFSRDPGQPLPEPALIVPDACPSCGSAAGGREFSHFGVCASCGHHLRLPARTRITQLVDAGTFVEEDADLQGADPLDFQDTRPYQERVASAQWGTGLTEAVVTGRARIGSHRIGLAVFDFGFLGGSMGVAVGEKLVRLFERAIDRGQPVILIATSGGARIQEGTVALSQMARVAAAVERHHAAGLLYISVLADPTTGGVMVSPASLGDVVLAEPGAYAAFAGRRVSLETEPMGAEWLQTRGMVDAVVARPALRETLTLLVGMLVHRNRPLQRPARAPYDIRRRLSPGPGESRTAEEDLQAAWEAVLVARRADRPTALDYIEQITHRFIELHGDRLYGDDEAIVGGLGTFAGQTVVFLGQERSRPVRGTHPPGRPYPEGFRKVLRLALLAAKFDLPIVTLIDTPGAQADVETEGRGLPFAIGRCLRVFSALPVPVVAAIIGEGGSGAAIALAVADRVLMLEHAVYEVIAPEGAAAILYRDAEQAPALADRMHITAPEALDLGVVDEIVPEPPGGAHTDFLSASRLLSESLVAALAESERWLPGRLVSQRYRRLRSIGTRYVQRRPSKRSAEASVPHAARPPVLGVDG